MTGAVCAAGAAFQDLIVTLSPTFVQKDVSGAGLATTDPCTATVTNGSTSLSYSWTRISGDPIDADTPSVSSTTFSYNISLTESVSAVFRCTVTDTSTGAVESVDVTVTITETT